METVRHRGESEIDDPILESSREEILHDQIKYQSKASFLELLLLLAKRKSFIFKFVFGAAVVAAVLSFVLPKTYTATTRIMPPQQTQSSLASTIMGQLGPLASLAGGNLNLTKNPSDVYIYMLHSRTIADDLIARFSLMQVYKEKIHAKAVDALRDHTEITSGHEGGIMILVSDHDPQRAADIANAYVDELKKLTQTLAVTEAGRRRIFFEHEVQQAMDDLSKAELGMKKTQEETGILMLEPQSRTMLESIASLHGQVAAKEAQVQAMRSFATDENPDLKRAENELAALRSELSRLESGKVGDSFTDIDLRKIPEKGLAYVRALRELKYREAVYEAMSKQYEIARVDEAKDAAIIQVLDKALPPEIRSWPKRSLIVLTVVVLTLFLVSIYILLVERIKADPAVLARFQLLKFHLLRNPVK